MAAGAGVALPAWAFEEEGADYFIVDVSDASTLLGGGAYGAVYSATYHGEIVAAKTLHALREPQMYGLVGPGADAAAVEHVLQEFRAEAEVLASVDHPNVLKFWGVCYGPTAGVRLPKWIVTERLPYSLHDFVRLAGMREAMSPHFALCLATDLAEGLAHLHGLGIVHRDLKPKNVLVGPQGGKLADLGTAKMIGIAARTAQHTVGPGTAIYHPPEVLAGEYTASIDIFSWGLTVWEIITGRSPERSGANDEANLDGRFGDRWVMQENPRCEIQWLHIEQLVEHTTLRLSADRATMDVVMGCLNDEVLLKSMAEYDPPELDTAGTAERVQLGALTELLLQFTERRRARLQRVYREGLQDTYDDARQRAEDAAMQAASTRTSLVTALAKVSTLEAQAAELQGQASEQQARAERAEIQADLLRGENEELAEQLANFKRAARAEILRQQSAGSVQPLESVEQLPEQPLEEPPNELSQRFQHYAGMGLSDCHNVRAVPCTLEEAYHKCLEFSALGFTFSPNTQVGGKPLCYFKSRLARLARLTPHPDCQTYLHGSGDSAYLLRQQSAGGSHAPYWLGGVGASERCAVEPEPGPGPGPEPEPQPEAPAPYDGPRSRDGTPDRRTKEWRAWLKANPNAR